MRKLYFWYRLTRTIGKAPSKTKWYAACGTDAQTTGRFSDSVTRVGFATIQDGQNASNVFDRYKREVTQYAALIGFGNVMIVSISEAEYRVIAKMEKFECEHFNMQFFGVRP